MPCFQTDSFAKVSQKVTVCAGCATFSHSYFFVRRQKTFYRIKYTQQIKKECVSHLTPKDESLSDLMKKLGADSASGLSSAEAEKRLTEHGENRLRERKKKTNLQRFAEQFKDVMILILLGRGGHLLRRGADLDDEPAEFFEPAAHRGHRHRQRHHGRDAGEQGRKGAGRAARSLSAPHARVIRERQGASHRRRASWCPGDIILAGGRRFRACRCAADRKRF